MLSPEVTDNPTVRSPSAQMIQLSSGFMLSQALYVAAELGIADLLANGTRSSAELAEATGTHAPSLYRLLRTLSSLGVFVERENHSFQLTPLGATLRSSGPESVRNWVLINGSIAWGSMGELLYSVQTGRPGFERAFGMPIFHYLAQHRDEAGLFARTMIDFHGPEAGAVAAAYSFSDLATLVDVGGGSGNLLATLLAANPELRGTLFDLPHVAEQAAQRLDSLGLGARCQVLQGDFFESVPTGGDAYLLSHIVHDWDNERCLKLLQNCRSAMGGGSRLLIVEMVLPGPNQRSAGKMMDLLMLVAPGGQERTESEYRELLAAAGFCFTRVVPTSSAVSIIEAIPD